MGFQFTARILRESSLPQGGNTRPAPFPIGGRLTTAPPRETELTHERSKLGTGPVAIERHLPSRSCLHRDGFLGPSSSSRGRNP